MRPDENLGKPAGYSSEPTLLTRYSSQIAQALEDTGLPRESFTGSMAAYHMGWVDESGQPSRSKPGKLLRPALCLWATNACGGEVHQSLSVAAALEWIHNFTLVHDDIQDGDRTRRNRPTVWAVWGSAQGINVGDALHALAFRTLASFRADAVRQVQAIRIIADAVLVVVEGQALDLRLERHPETSPRTYLRMIRAKTAALIGASLETGAVIAGAPASTASALRKAGTWLGMAFQMRDDWLGTWGDCEATGKSASGDLGRCKLTYPVVAAYNRMHADQRARMRELFAAPSGGSSEVRKLLEDAGGASVTQLAPRQFADKAAKLVRSLDLSHHCIDEFTEVADYVANRSR